MSTAATPVRLDKWLWAARFFKTRSLAQQAVNGGKVQVNGQRAKASHELRLGVKLSIRRGYERIEVDVLGLTEKRGSASFAQALYLETAESREKREKEAEIRKMAALAAPRSDHKPDKRERRQLHKLKTPLD